MDSKPKDQTHSNSQSPGKSTARRAQRKLTAEEFTHALESAKRSAGSKHVRAEVARLIRAGFAGEMSDTVLNHVIESLADVPDIDNAALRLAVADRAGKLNAGARRILLGLRRHFRILISFPQIDSDLSMVLIESWLSRVSPMAWQPLRSASERLGSQEIRPPAPQWLRASLLCVMGHSDPTLVREAVFLLVRKQYDWSRKAKASNLSENGFFHMLGHVVGSSSLPAGRLERLLVPLAPYQRVLEDTKQSYIRAELRQRQAEDELGAHERNERSLAAELEKTKTLLQEATAGAENLTEKLAEAVEKQQALESYWKRISTERLARQAGDFNRRLQHEIQEALLSIGSSPPELEMATSRLRQMQEFLDSTMRESQNANRNRD
jgi:hypothetical protein